MLPVEEQLSILVHLSMADNYMAEEEKNMIISIGESNGLSREEIEVIIDNPKPIPKVRDLPPDEKFTYLYNVVKLMKIDHKIFRSEIEFCEKMALALGYRPGVIAELSAHIYTDPDINPNKNYLRSIADDYLLIKDKH